MLYVSQLISGHSQHFVIAETCCLSLHHLTLCMDVGYVQCGIVVSKPCHSESNVIASALHVSHETALV